MTISQPTKEEINLCAIIVESYTPDELVNEMKKMERIIKKGNVDIINGAKVVALLQAARGFI
jgi:predicted nucleic acid-binding protein